MPSMEKKGGTQRAVWSTVTNPGFRILLLGRASVVRKVPGLWRQCGSLISS